MYYNKVYKFHFFYYFMRELKKEEDLMVKLNPIFQANLFSELIKKYSRKELSKKLNKSEPLLYHYKNNKVKAIPKVVLIKAIDLSDFSKKDFKENILKKFSAKESIKEIMDKGAKINHENIKKRFSIKFGAYSLLNEKRGLLNLDTLEWLDKNKWIEKLKKQKGLIKNVQLKKISRKDVEVNYFAYNKKTKKCEFYITFLPRNLVLNNDFSYFLGLLFGDGLHGARVGIVNKDKTIIEWTSNFLKEYFEKNSRKSQLLLYRDSLGLKIKNLCNWLEPLSEVVEVYNNPKARGNYVFNIFITNKILRRILDDFLFNLENLFSHLGDSQKGAFLAGFFDAEGNVNKLDRNLRFSQKKENNVKIIQAILDKEGYHLRYDGSNIIIGYNKKYKGDLNLFKKQILPFLKHSKKAKEAKELIEGYLVREEYKPILEFILKNPGISQKKVAINFQRIKYYRKLLALFKAGFVDRKRNRIDESFKYYITNQGLKYLEKN